MLILVRTAKSLRERVRWKTLALLFVILFGSVANHFVPPQRVAWLREARRVFPKVNIAPRLATLRPALSVTSHSETDDQSDLVKEYDEIPFRIHGLRKVHSAQYEAFIERLGFGLARIISIDAEGLKIPELEDIKFDAKHTTAPSENTTLTFNPNESPVFDFANLDPLAEDAFLKRTYADFLHPATLGYSPKRKEVIGFSTHGFRFALPKLFHEPYALRLQRLELVSLLNFETPRVYVLDHLPRMDQLGGNDVQTRELDSFESNGLSQLRVGKRIMIEEQSQRVRMLGPIPMLEQCQQCHDGAVGDLLGAFSYEFHW